MRRLSASSTAFYKRIFPAFWFGFLAVFLTVGAWGFAHSNAPIDPGRAIPFLVGPVFMAAFGFFLFRQLVFDLMDEVWLDGDQLLVKNRHQQTRVALADVVNVNATIMTNPRRITLMLRTDSRFGRNITFMPASGRGFLGAFRMDPIATELIGRIDAIRQGRR